MEIGLEMSEKNETKRACEPWPNNAINYFECFT